MGKERKKVSKKEVLKMHHIAIDRTMQGLEKVGNQWCMIKYQRQRITFATDRSRT
jgi:hypothetical protein